ncbi:MAG TPA: sugar ABC transporter permease [Candidatus Limnocylindrales bacterium]|jgi:multiple sugar transport system permease protein
MAVSGAAREPSAGPMSERRAEMLAGFALIALPMFLFLTLKIGAILYAVFISFFRWGLRGPRNVEGFDNYQRLITDPVFHKAIANTVYYAAVWVPLTMALGLFLAVIVNQKIRGQTFFRAAFYFPAIASSAAITVLWIFLFQPSGLFNDVRAALGLNPLFEVFGIGPNHNWIGTSNTALNTIIALNVWTTSGTFMLFYLAYLQTISKDVYEAAAIDGAGPWQTFWKVTFPLLRPGHFFVATVAAIGAFQVFDQAYIGGGVDGTPNNALTTIVLYLFRKAIADFEFGYAAAVGVVLFIIIMAVTLIQRRLFGQTPAWN